MLDIRIFTILTVAISFNNQLVLSDEQVNYCYSTDEHPYLNAGTKTPYEFTHGLIKNNSVPNCDPVQIWMLTRHGTRYPGKKEINNIKNILPGLQSSIIENAEKRGNVSLCEEDLELLKTWIVDPYLSTETSKYLSKQGERDLESLGKRIKGSFPELLENDSDDLPVDKFKFRATDTQRTVASMEYFIKGAMGNVSMNNTVVVPLEEDILLKLYKICKPWLKEMKSPATNAEVNAFLAGPEFKQVVHDVSKRLGFEDDLPFESVLSMYTECVFERAWVVDKLSPWCAAFTENELKVFEYEEDLYYYDHASYGVEMSPRIGCITLQDMFNHFEKLENGNTSEEPRGIFYFSHNVAVELLLRTMGLAEDSSPLTASNFQSKRDNRKWRTATLAPFAANLAAVFYKCDSSNKVRFYLNEKPLDIEGCEMGVCDWEYLKKKLGSTAFNCNVDFCFE